MIKCRNLCVEYPHDGHDTHPALQDLSLDIGDSEFIALIGPNGSGKSTLALSLAGLQVLSSGTIEIDGNDINDLIRSRLIRDIVGIVFQNPDDQLVTNIVEREIAFALENRAVPVKEMERIVEQALHRFRIDGLKGRSPNQLSGGQKQKLALASVMIANPKFLILDEPTSFLDTPDRREILKRLRAEFNERKNDGFTVLLITQFSREAALCDRIIVVDNGRIAADASPEDLFTSQRSLLDTIGVEIPIEYRLSQAIPDIHLPASLFDY